MRAGSVLVLFLLGACGDPPAPPPRGVPNPSGLGAAPPSEEPTSAPAPEGHRAADTFGSARPVEPSFRAATSAEPAAAAERGTEPARAAAPWGTADALRAALGDPSSCITSSPDAPNEVRVSVHVQTSATGVVTRAEVRAAGLSEADVDCIERRAASIHLPAAEAPRSASTELLLRR